MIDRIPLELVDGKWIVHINNADLGQFISTEYPSYRACALALLEGTIEWRVFRVAPNPSIKLEKYL